MRIQVGHEPLLWARIADDYWDYEYLVSSRCWTNGLQIIPPLRFDLAREIAEADPVDRDKLWARHIVELLQAHEPPLLTSGEYVLLNCRSFADKGTYEPSSRLVTPPASYWQQVPKQAQQGLHRWDIDEDTAPLALRNPVSLDAGRVHAWRKRARTGSLPPILLWWFSGLCRYLILDGIHRAIAALEEGTLPPCLVLTGYREAEFTWEEGRRAALSRGLDREVLDRRTGISVERANRMLIEAYDQRPDASFKTAAWPMLGGRDRWVSEVQAELDAIGVSDSEMLCDLAPQPA